MIGVEAAEEDDTTPATAGLSEHLEIIEELDDEGENPFNVEFDTQENN